jgi:hypothetical protein
MDNNDKDRQITLSGAEGNTKFQKPTSNESSNGKYLSSKVPTLPS